MQRTSPIINSNRSAYILLLLAPVLFASNMIVARWADGAVPPVALAFWRWTGTFLLLMPLVGWQLWTQRAILRRELGTLLILGALGMGVCGAPVYIAGRTTSATNIGLIYAVSPILIVLLGWLGWRQRLVPVQGLAILLCLAGVLVIIAKGSIDTFTHLSFTAGDLWTAFAVCGWALYSVLLKHRPSKLDLTTRFAAIVGAGVLVMLPFYLLEMAMGSIMSVNPQSIGIAAFLALVPGLGAYLAYGKLIERLGPQRTSLLMYLIPVYTAILAYLLLGERLHSYHLAGIALILPGLYLSTRRARS